MHIYPAIDLKQGQVVRLRHGDFEQMTIYAHDPAEQAQKFIHAGCEWIHVVDLDGAVAGASVNKKAVQEIVNTGAKIQLGGGIRSLQNIEDWLEAGVARVILGTAAIKNPDLVKQAAQKYPEKIAVGADAREGKIAAGGWLETTEMEVSELVKRFEDCGVAAVIFTDIGRDGALTGVNVKATAALASAVSVPIIASGGVKSVDDIIELSAFSRKGIEGVITGRAIYDGRLDLMKSLSTEKILMVLENLTTGSIATNLAALKSLTRGGIETNSTAALKSLTREGIETNLTAALKSLTREGIETNLTAALKSLTREGIETNLTSLGGVTRGDIEKSLTSLGGLTRGDIEKSHTSLGGLTRGDIETNLTVLESFTRDNLEKRLMAIKGLTRGGVETNLMALESLTKENTEKWCMMIEGLVKGQKTKNTQEGEEPC